MWKNLDKPNGMGERMVEDEDDDLECIPAPAQRVVVREEAATGGRFVKLKDRPLSTLIQTGEYAAKLDARSLISFLLGLIYCISI